VQGPLHIKYTGFRLWHIRGSASKKHKKIGLQASGMDKVHFPSAPPGNQNLSCKGNAVAIDSIFANRSFLWHIRGAAPL
jgi:hypothetical protein